MVRFSLRRGTLETMAHPIHTTPDAKNDRGDRTLALALIVRDRLWFGQTASEIRADLVPGACDPDEFFLALAAARILSKEIS